MDSIILGGASFPPFLLLCALVLGGVLGYSLTMWHAQKQVAHLKQRISDLTLEQQQHLHDQMRLELELEHAKQLQQERILWHEKTQDQLHATFSKLAHDALHQAQHQLVELAQARFEAMKTQHEQLLNNKQQAFEELLHPIKRNLQTLEGQRVDEKTQWQETYTTLLTLIKQQQTGQDLLQQETRGLHQALHATHVRGVWGELQLKRIVELAGMSPHCDFERQPSLIDEEGKVKRPDLIVRLPQGRQMAIDAKAPLKGYLEALEASSEGEKNAKLQTHAQQLKAHIQQLAQKQYWKELPSMDCVILFLPGEVFLDGALQQAPDLIEWAAGKGILLATPTSLIALLKNCAHSWHQATLEQKVHDIVECGQELYNRLYTLSTHFEELRKSLLRSGRLFNEIIGSWEGRVLVSARKLHNLLPQEKPLHKIDRVDLTLRTSTAERETLKPTNSELDQISPGQVE